MKFIKNILIIWSLGILLLCSASCSPSHSDAAAGGQPKKLADFNGKQIAVQDGTVQIDLLNERLPDAQLQLYNSEADVVSAMEAGAVDAISLVENSANDVMAKKTGFVKIEEPVGALPIALAFPKSQRGDTLCRQMNEYYEKTREDGSLQKMIDKWMEDGAMEKYPAPDLTTLTGDSGEIIYATTGTSSFFNFFTNDQPNGLELEMVYQFCEMFGYRMKVETAYFSSIIPGLVTGTYDIAGNGIFVTEERKESVNFSESYISMNVVLCTKGSDTTAGITGFFDRLKSGFEKTFIREDRWKMVAKGVGTTIYISFFATLIGTALGFLLCLIRIKKIKGLRAVTTVFIKIMQGTPLVVLLMLSFYLIFAGSGLSGEWVSIIAFALNFSAYVCEILQAGVEAIDPGQIEAGLACGYTRTKAFNRIVMPQVIINVLPVYKAQFISLVKMTAIVGYIAVEDLTRVSDIIRSRTYDAFFPIIVTAIIYFVISWGLAAIIDLIEYRIEPDREHRVVKGVKMQ